MSLAPRPIQWNKKCLQYCGDERCDCGASPYAQAMKEVERQENPHANLRKELIEEIVGIMSEYGAVHEVHREKCATTIVDRMKLVAMFVTPGRIK